MAGEPGNVEGDGEDFDEWYGGQWCKVCALTIGMAKLGWCDWQKKLRAQGKECPKLLPGENTEQNKKPLRRCNEE